MKYLRILGLLTTLAAATVGIPAGASASVATSPAGTAYTSTIQASSVGNVLFKGIVDTECTKHFGGTIVGDGVVVTVSAPISSMTFSNCTGGSTVIVSKAGTMEFHSIGGGSGTVTISGLEVKKVAHSLGLSCVYTATGVQLGTLTGGAKAVLDLNAKIPRTGGSVFCGSSGELLGSMQINTPASLFLS
jgi:hypothetical protein